MLSRAWASLWLRWACYKQTEQVTGHQFGCLMHCSFIPRTPPPLQHTHSPKADPRSPPSHTKSRFEGLFGSALPLTPL